MSKFLPYKILSIEDLPNEEWRKIPNLSGNFYASNLGRIKTKEFDVTINGVCHTVPEFIIPQYKDKNGYLVSDVAQKRSSHRLIASAFLGNFTKLPVVNHINGNRDENWISNLEMCSYKENSAHMIARKKRGGKSISIDEILAQKREKMFRGEFMLPKTVLLIKACFAMMIISLCSLQIMSLPHMDLVECVISIFAISSFILYGEFYTYSHYLHFAVKAKNHRI